MTNEKFYIQASIIGDVKLVNTTPHPIRFDYNGEPVELPTSGVLINAKIEEKIVQQKNGVTFVRSTFVTDEKSSQILAEIEEMYPDAIIVGSIIAAQAYPGRVFGLTPAPGYERVPVDQKRMCLDKFVTFAESR